MTPSEAKRALEAAEARYWAEVDRVAAELHASYVVPFCNKTGARFIAGMGGYVFSTKKGRELGGIFYGSTDDMPKRLAAAVEVETMGGQCIGSLMLDYTPENY